MKRHEKARAMHEEGNRQVMANNEASVGRVAALMLERASNAGNHKVRASASDNDARNATVKNGMQGAFVKAAEADDWCCRASQEGKKTQTTIPQEKARHTGIRIE